MYKKIGQNTLLNMCIHPVCSVREAMIAIGKSEIGTAFIVVPIKNEFKEFLK